MQTIARDNYTAEQVKAALHYSNRKIAFRYELLDKNNQYKKALTTVFSEGSSINYDLLAEIKRTAQFTLKDDGTINFLSDRIKPYCRLYIPPGRVLARYYTFLQPQFPALYKQIQEAPETGGWVEWPLGVFLLSTPSRKTNYASKIREVEAYDQLQVLKDDRVTGRYLIPAGTNFITAIKNLLDGAGITNQNLTPTTKTLPVDREWDGGTPKLEIINELLEALGYDKLYFDENGYAVAKPYTTPDQRASEYTYKNDDLSVIVPDTLKETLDLFNVPNQWVLVVSEPDRAPLKSIYTNDNPNSPTSTVSRGRTIVDYRQVDAPDQETLDTLAQQLAYKASQVYQEVVFETGIMPMHSHNDVYTLEHSKLGISAKFEEIGWSFELSAGANMRHIIRRVVSV